MAAATSPWQRFPGQRRGQAGRAKSPGPGLPGAMTTAANHTEQSKSVQSHPTPNALGGIEVYGYGLKL